MKKTFLALFLGGAFTLASCGGDGPKERAQEAKTEEAKEKKEATETAMVYDVDNAETVIKWEGKKRYVESYHEGDIKVKSGMLSVEGENLTAGNFVIDMETIVNHDLDDEKNKAKLVGHLQSDDFFHVAEYPEATFEITDISALEGDVENTHEISGNLTMRGTSKNITFPAKVTVSGDHVKAKATFAIDRKRWNVSYGAESTFEEITDKMKDKVIDDQIDLDIHLVAKATSAEK